MRRIFASSISVDGSNGRHDTYGSALAAQPGRSKGRPANNTSSQLIVQNGLPTLTCSRCPSSRMVAPYARAAVAPTRQVDTAIIMPVNNPLERLMREIRRRTRVVGAFPDGQSALNLAAARLRHIAATRWSTKRYLDMKLLEQRNALIA